MASKWATTFLLIAISTALTVLFFEKKESFNLAKEESEPSLVVDVSDDGYSAVIPSITDEKDHKYEYDEDFVKELLKPRQLKYFHNGTAMNHQLLHLHHMKTGGTSTEQLLRCGVKNEHNKINMQSIHECSAGRYERCVSGGDEKCTNDIDQSAIVSYCAPMADLPVFGWEDDEENKINKITVLRHPVDRVWSMFRFQTKSCYQCTPLKEVYAAIDAGDTASMRGNCKNQLLNHMTRNMLTSKVETEALNEVHLQEAIKNLEGFIVGLTGKLPETVDNIKKVFPFLKDCQLEHANSSPKNNRCGEDNTHWDLPSFPDEETRQIIIDHNPLDMALYEAAVAQFEVQSMVLQNMD